MGRFEEYQREFWKRGFELIRVRNGIYQILRAGEPVATAKNTRELKMFLMGYDIATEHPCKTPVQCFFEAIKAISLVRKRASQGRKRLNKALPHSVQMTYEAAFMYLANAEDCFHSVKKWIEIKEKL